MSDDNIRAQHEAFNELKRVLESKTRHFSESKEKIERLDAALDKMEEKNQKITSEILERKNKEIELKEKVEDLEKQLYRMPTGSNAKENEVCLQAKKVIEVYIKTNSIEKANEQFQVSQLDKKYLRTDNDPAGGYLTPFEYYLEILKKITEISPIRQVARVLRTSRESLHIPVRETLVAGDWVGEGITYPTNNSTYGIREIKVNKLSVSSETTIELIQDSPFNVEDQITQDISESFAQTEGRAYVLGDGVAKPEGILAKAFANVVDVNSPQIINSGIANSFDGDSLIDIAGQLKTGYNPVYLLNRRTLAFVRKLKDGIGQYLWTPGIANAYPNLINGHPYVSTIDVPDVAANAFPVIFGDIFRGYTIVDHIMMYLIRDQFTQSKQGKVVFNAIRRVGGQVTLAEAIKILKCSV